MAAASDVPLQIVQKVHGELLIFALYMAGVKDVQTVLIGLIVAVAKKSIMATVRLATIDCFQTLNDQGFATTRPKN